VRLAATLLGAVLVLAGTLIGTDDDFPFGPFRMYSTTDRLDAPVADTRMDAVDTTGRRRVLTDADTGIRRAEIEGQLDRFAADPALLSVVARAYRRHRPTAAPLTEISVIIRWHDLRHGRPTGSFHDQTLVVWRS
jgi:hypothetical protein